MRRKNDKPMPSKAYKLATLIRSCLPDAPACLAITTAALLCLGYFLIGTAAEAVNERLSARRSATHSAVKLENNAQACNEPSTLDANQISGVCSLTLAK